MKKKILVVLTVLVLLSPSLFAQKMKGMGGVGISYMNTTRFGECYGVDDGWKVNVTSNVPAINAFVYVGDLVGFYGSVTVGIPLDRTDSVINPAGQTSGSYYTDRLASTHDFIFVDALVGLGVNLALGNSLGVLVGAGVDYSLLYLRPKDLSTNAYIDQMLGLGAEGKVWIAFTKVLVFDIGVIVSYDFLPLWRSDGQLYENTRVTQALNMGINVGLAVKM